MNFGKISTVCIIGGGEPMIHFGSYLKSKGVNVSAIIAPRHEETLLPRTGLMMKQSLNQNEIEYICTDDINNQDFINEHIQKKQFDIIVCFGPAWVFNNELLEACDHKIVNFNGIPVPRYLGGAHYTWQILNRDKTSGMIIQHITSNLDKGAILKAEYCELPDYVRIPQDYFEENFHIACTFLENFADDILSEIDFSEKEFETVMPQRQYFPRLLTIHQAFVDWSWDGKDIELFCCAFDKPYQGASSFVSTLGRVFLKDVTFVTGEIEPHPFCNGLVIRKFDGVLNIAARGGLLRVRTVYDKNNIDMMPYIREGYRFYVDQGTLDNAYAYKPEIKAGSTK